MRARRASGPAHDLRGCSPCTARAHLGNYVATHLSVPCRARRCGTAGAAPMQRDRHDEVKVRTDTREANTNNTSRATLHTLLLRSASWLDFFSLLLRARSACMRTRNA